MPFVLLLTICWCIAPVWYKKYANLILYVSEFLEDLFSNGDLKFSLPQYGLLDIS
ncbi:hypothetical protein HNO87_000597 [Acinetobacter schindleri]|nr:hypothetical protein [Acinetobacter schindleri]